MGKKKRSQNPALFSDCTKADVVTSGGGKGGGKKEGGTLVTAVLKVDFHCEGCVDKIRRSLKGFKGVEGVKMDRGANKVTVVGTMDPWKLRDRMQKKTKKNVEVLSPQQKKQGGGKQGGGEKQNTGHNEEETKKGDKEEENCDNSKEAEEGDKKDENSCNYEKEAEKGDKKDENSCNQKGNQKDGKKGDQQAKKGEKQESTCQPKGEGKKGDKQVVVVNTVVLKVALHCDGCIRRIRGTLMKIEGVEQVAIDTQKNQITVKGTMKTKGFVEFVSKKIQRHVELADPKKEEKEKEEKKEKDEKKEKEKQMTCHADMGWCNCDKCRYHVYMVPAPQLFSDDNPNACFVM